MNRAKVVLADDHAVLREGLRALINSQPDMEVVAEAGTGPEAVEKVRETGARVLCLDLSMPGWGSAATIERVRAASPRTRVLILTMHDDPAYVRSAVTAGADGYILKTTPVARLIAAIRDVAAGERVIDGPLQAYLDHSPDHSPTAGKLQLSRREREVLELLSKGHTHQEIADKLFVSVKTVETYRARIRDKTGLKSRADFVRFGLDNGYLTQADNPGDVPSRGTATPS
jgi:two-component system, NarL family, response regulator NreC